MRASLTTTTGPEAARDVRAKAWKYIFDCYEQKKAYQSNGSQYARKVTNKGGQHDLTPRLPGSLIEERRVP